MGDAGFIEEPPGVSASDIGEREKHVLSRNKFVAEVFCFFLGAIEDLVQLARNIGLCITLFRISRCFLFALVAKRCDTYAQFLKNGNYYAFVLTKEGEQQVKVIDDRVACAACDGNRFIQGLAGFYCQTIWIYHALASCNVSAPKLCQLGGQVAKKKRVPEGTRSRCYFRPVIVNRYDYLDTSIFFTNGFPSTSRRYR